MQAVAETAGFLGTALVIYLSLNAVTHPVTLRLKLTHLWPWPSEGTVRVIALGVCLAAVAVDPLSAAPPPAQPPGRAAARERRRRRAAPGVIGRAARPEPERACF